MSDIYVLVADNDQLHPMPYNGKPYYDDGGPLVFEQYTNAADIDSIKARIARLKGRYGKCRIARLEFIDDKDINQTSSCNICGGRMVFIRSKFPGLTDKRLVCPTCLADTLDDIKDRMRDDYGQAYKVESQEAKEIKSTDPHDFI